MWSPERSFSSAGALCDPLSISLTEALGDRPSVVDTTYHFVETPFTASTLAATRLHT